MYTDKFSDYLRFIKGKEPAGPVPFNNTYTFFASGTKCHFMNVKSTCIDIHKYSDELIF